MEGQTEQTASRWERRPWAARLLRATVLVVPIVASIVAGYLLTALLPTVAGRWPSIGRWLGITALSTVVLVFTDRFARRLLPLARLLDLTLLFPDRAPSRFSIALRTGTTAQLERKIAAVQRGETKLAEAPADAARELIELVAALGRHDRLTRGHSERVRAYSQLIGEQVGMSEIELDRLRWAGLLHDIGKLRVPTEILNKPGRLTDEEFAIIKQHPEHGRVLAGGLAGWLGESIRAVWEHHERWDGKGYPRGLTGTEAALPSRIVSVADTYDVITSLRSYKKATPASAARAELARCAGSQFDPDVVRAFMNVSLGSLRRVMGPLSWLAHLTLFPRQLIASAVPQAAAALTVVVGASGAQIGTVLAERAPIIDRPSIVEMRTPGDGRIESNETEAGGAPPQSAGEDPTDTAAPSAPGAQGEPESSTAPGDTTPPTGSDPVATTPGEVPDTTPTGTTPTGTTPTGTTPTGPTPTSTPATLLPGITVLPAVSLPGVSLPPITLPPVSIPPITVPSISTPLITLPPVVITVPVTLPPITLPPITLPPITLPPITLPHL